MWCDSCCVTDKKLEEAYKNSKTMELNDHFISITKECIVCNLKKTIIVFVASLLCSMLLPAPKKYIECTRRLRAAQGKGASSKYCSNA